MKTIKTHIGTILILVLITIIGYLTSSGGLWLTKVYPAQAEYLGIGIIALFVLYMVYRIVYTMVDTFDQTHINEH